MPNGYLSIVLHAHLPYVRHPEYDEFLEEEWLFEAITETYIPILKNVITLIDEGVDFRLTISISHSLLSMLLDPILQSRYLTYLNRIIELASKEVVRTRWLPKINNTALIYFWKLSQIREFFLDQCKCSLVTVLKEVYKTGKIDLITCAATHAYLPLIAINKKAVKAQIRIACLQFERVFGVRPKGIWLPECGYTDALDEILNDEGLTYFFVETHGVLFASPRPKYGVYAPIYNKDGIAVFGRDMESSRQVWSSVDGYPGDPFYRDFYRDIGYDLDLEYIQRYIQPDGMRKSTGIKYYRITGNTRQKEPYDCMKAIERAAEHAKDFMIKKIKQAQHIISVTGKPPIIVAPYDAELFGHWWYEGPDWIDMLIRKIFYDQNKIKLITPREYLDIYPMNQLAAPAQSSWGYKGYNDVWLDDSNKWIYRHVHKAADLMTEIADQFPEEKGIRRRVLNQAARELLLAQSSDWAFIMKAGTTVTYALERIKTHLSNFTKLYNYLLESNIDEVGLIDLEKKNNIFPELDYRVYS